ncbi:hypothetical protein [Micromonospora sp. NPDC049679]|uniref:hypothetical protein n=1 Tax=Micromonospora sp. NPDC049679 TaxID=3155920 RepID=UPI00340CEA8A
MASAKIQDAGPRSQPAHGGLTAGAVADSTNDTIGSAVEEQAATSKEMTRNVAAAAVGSGSITKAIAELADAARSTNAGVTETEQAAGQLADLSGELEHRVARFRY